ncbi:MAG TPA: O-antigen ligase family protein [Geomonas sp.]|nr:O-antigen ligase family protein [Geomonas sp.]
MPSYSALAYLVFFFSGSLATLYISPFFGVLLYEVQYLANPPGRWWYGDLMDLRYSLVIMLMTCLSFALRRERFTRNRVFEAPPAKWLLLLTLVMLLTSLWAISPAVHGPEMLRYLKVLAFIMIAYKTVDTAAKLEAVLALYVAAISYLSILGWESGRSGGGRLEGLGCADGSDANGTALVVGTVIPLLIFYLLFGKSRWARIAALAALVFNLNSLVLLNSRGALLAFLASSGWMALSVFRESSRRVHKLQIIAGLLLGAGLFYYLADETFLTRMATLHSLDPDAEEIGTHRVDFWMATFQMLKEYPFGGGARTFQLLSRYYLPAEWLSDGSRVVHSMWFEVLSEYGYHGLFLFVGFVVSSFGVLARCKRQFRETNDSYHLFQATTLQGTWLSLLVASSFVNNFYGELTFWLPAFIAAFGSIHLSKEGDSHAYDQVT